MIRGILIIALFTCACITSQAQVNLVKNPSLEEHWRCPIIYDEIALANYWSCIDTMHTFPALGDTFGDPNCTPEYMCTCGSPGITSVPSNDLFYHYPRTGNGMAQVAMYFDTGYVTPYQRDYLQGRLYAPLAAGQSYCITFFVVLEGTSKYAVNNIGAYLDDGSIDTNSNCGYPHPEDVPQAISTTIITDTTNWTKIQGSFIANGTERYITIGNFYDNAHTSVTDLRPSVFTGTYGVYLVDDISVIASNTTAYAGRDTTINYGDSTYIGVDSNGDGMPCYWYVAGGVSPIDSGGRINVRPGVTTTYVVSMDLCGTVSYDTVVVRVVPEGVGNVQMSKYGNVEIYPNPTTGSFTIEGAAGCEVRVVDMFGRSVMLPAISGTGTMTNNKEVVDISNLVAGVYVVEVVDGSGEKRCLRLVKE